ncbi:MAG: plasmid recombination protein [Clostridium sp.]|nr:plasmid recombination protein [Clostridium sp.]
MGEEFIISDNVHLDETTPHMHVSFVPIIDNLLSAKKICKKLK